MTHALSLPQEADGEPAPVASDLPALLCQAYTMIGAMLERIRESQGVLEGAAVQKLQDTSAQLSQVSSTTLTAATDIMDGLDRALALVDRLDGGPTGDGVRDELRDEIFMVMNHMQFQDITAQQLQHAASLLRDMESQLVDVARLFHPVAHGAAAPASPAREEMYPRAFDPAASIHDAKQRQALVDELLK